MLVQFFQWMWKMRYVQRNVQLTIYNVEILHITLFEFWMILCTCNSDSEYTPDLFSCKLTSKTTLYSVESWFLQPLITFPNLQPVLTTQIKRCFPPPSPTVHHYNNLTLKLPVFLNKIVIYFPWIFKKNKTKTYIILKHVFDINPNDQINIYNIVTFVSVTKQWCRKKANVTDVWNHPYHN